MIVILDVQYADELDCAGVGVVVARDWLSRSAEREFSDLHYGLADYVPGQFYLRELPCLLPTLHRVLADNEISSIVIDGYVDLAEGRAGLGRHLYNAIEQRIEVIGIAKNEFSGAPALSVLRGKSKRPLWVTSTADQQAAAQRVATMGGDARIPALVNRADRVAREIIGVKTKS